MLPKFFVCDDNILKAKKTKANPVSVTDEMSFFLLFVDYIACLVNPLCNVYNLILKDSLYASAWNMSRIIPMFKLGDKKKHTEIQIYRTII